MEKITSSRHSEIKGFVEEQKQITGQLSALYGKSVEVLQSIERFIHDIKDDDLSSGMSVRMGELCFELGLFENAKFFFEKAAALDPRSSDAFNNLGVIHVQYGDFDTAGRFFRKALDIDPHNPDAIINLSAINENASLITSRDNPADDSIELSGTTGNIFPLRTLPRRSIVSVFDRGRELFRIMKQLAAVYHRVLRIRYYRIARPLAVFLYRNQRRIVFISDRPAAREAKIGSALVKAGWEVILLYKFLPNYELNQYFTHNDQYDDFEHSFRLARKYKASLYHIFTDANNYVTAWNYCLYKPRLIVVDFIDTIVGILSDDYLEREAWRKKLVPLEKYIIEQADGFCCRDLQVQATSRVGGYRRSKKTILFPEYCWGPGQLKRSPRISDDDDSIHVVLIGHFGIEKAGCQDTGYLDIIRPLLEQGIHFHIYPHQNYYDVYYKDGFDGIFEDYINLERDNPYFHIHAPVRVESITEEISRYDFGIHVVRAHLFDETLRDYRITARKVGGSSRISDYLDAGLPVISQSGQYFYQYLTRFGIMLDLTKINLNNIKPELAAMKSAATRDRVQEFRGKMSVGNQVERLTTFYQSMINT